MTKLYFYFFLFFISISGAIAQKPADDNNRRTDIAGMERLAHERLRDMTGDMSMDSFTVASDNFDVHHYRCEWLLNPSVKFINGKVTVLFTIKSSTNKIVFDLASQLSVDSILYRGAPISFQKVLKDGLQVQFPAAINAGQKDSLIIYYQGVPDPLGTGVFYQGFHRGNPTIWTLSEPYGAKEWWPCKNGLTDKADSIDIIVTYPEGNMASSNGVIVSESVSGGQVTTHFRHRYPIASYLVAMAISSYVVDKDSVLIGGRQMSVLTYTYSVSRPGYYRPALDQAKLCLKKFSDLFGLYPFYKEHYCQTQWGAGGGMEHQTNSYIVDRWADLVSHELGHQWFGDKVTCGSWEDIWLNEGFATYTTNIYYEHFDTAMLRPTLQAYINSVTSQPGGSVWVDDTTKSSRIFNGRLTYYKGSYVVHMLRWVLGDSVFFKGIRRYLDDAAVTYSFARTSNLRKILEAESGKNLELFFQKWIYGEGYPNYHAEWSQNNNNWIKLKLNQTTSHNSVSFYEMPVTIVVKSGSRESSFVVDHRYSGQEFWLDAGFAVDTVMIDPKLWILSKTKTSAKMNSGSPVSNEIKIFPNPAPSQFTVSLKNPTDKRLTIQLLNTLGQTVYKKEVQTPGYDALIEVSTIGLAKGIYLLKLQSEKSIQYVRKIVH
jgi:aminopeptidase N